MQKGLITLNDLRTKFLAAGQYTVIVDSTKTPIAAASGIVRLIPGFSAAGNWNAPFFIERGDKETATRLYGSIDKTLERQGSWFHRAIDQSLEEGSVLALNLLKTVDEVDENGVPTDNADTVKYASFATAPSDTNSSNDRKKLLASFYNKERFWSASPEYLLATRDIVDQNQILNIVNLGKRNLSIIIRKSNVKGFNITAKDWYEEASEIPSFIKPDDLIGDYFVDVIAVAGNFTNYQKLKNDVTFAEYFDDNGLIIEKLDQFLSNSNVTVLNFFTGSLIPNFLDKRGSNQSIQEIINNQTASSGLLCAVDYKELDKFETNTNVKSFDLVGHTLIANPYIETDFLSYKKRLNVDNVYDENIEPVALTLDSSVGVTISNLSKRTLLNVSDANPDFEDFAGALYEGMTFVGQITAAGENAGIGDALTIFPHLYVTKIMKTENSVTIELTNESKSKETPNSGSFVDLLNVGGEVSYYLSYNKFTIDNTLAEEFYIAGVDSKLYEDFKSGKITSGAILETVSATFYLKLEDYYDPTNLSKGVKVSVYSDAELATIESVIPTFGSSVDQFGFVVNSGIVFRSASNSGFGNIEVDVITDKIFKIPSAQNFLTVNNLIVGTNTSGEEVLVRISSIKKEGSDLLVETELPYKQNISTDLSTVTVNWFNKLENLYDNYNLAYMEGFRVRDVHVPNGTTERMKEIYSVMTEGNISKALIDPDFVSWRYLIDTFNQGLEPFSKRNLTKLVKDRQKAMALLNMPSVNEFRNSSDPMFSDAPTPTNPLQPLSIEYIRDGGNVSANPSFLFSLPSEADGASFGAWFFPNQILREDSGEEFNMPPAPLCGNAFMRKWNNNTPFIAVANDAGELIADGLSRPEIHLDKGDRGALKELGVNPIYRKNGRILIYGNSTGYQKFSSILNHVHARDILITLEIDIENILSSFEFKSGIFTDETNRTLVETSLNNYLENMRDASRAIVSFDVIFDRKNNPDWVINSGAAIVDLVVTIPEVTDRFITRINLSRSGGGVSVGAFTAV